MVNRWLVAEKSLVSMKPLVKSTQIKKIITVRPTVLQLYIIYEYRIGNRFKEACLGLDLSVQQL